MRQCLNSVIRRFQCAMNTIILTKPCNISIVSCLIFVMSHYWSVSIMASRLPRFWLHEGRRLQELLV